MGLEAVERDIVIAGRNVGSHALQAGISEAVSVRLDGREFVVVTENDGNFTLAAKSKEAFIAEAVVARLDGVTQRHAVPLARQQVQEARNVVAVEVAARGEHPQD